MLRVLVGLVGLLVVLGGLAWALGAPVGAPGTTEHVLVLVPHFQRGAFFDVLCTQLRQYLPAWHPAATFDVLGIEQQDAPVLGYYNKGLSWNLALAWLRAQGVGPGQAVVLQDVDAVPRRYVDYACPPRGAATSWFLTTGGLKGRLGDLWAAGGFPMYVVGWGQEDLELWRRLQRVGVAVHPWPDEAHPRPPVVLNLEWAQDEAHLARHFWGPTWADA